MSQHHPSRFDLEKAIAAWRHVHARRRVFLEDDLDELERHLRDQTAHLVATGLGQEVAFRTAVQALGDLDGGEAEYRKVRWGKLRRRRQLMHDLQWRLSMLKNYLKIALRNLRKQKGYSFINISGLAIGLACSFFILLWVQDELSYDRFMKDGDRIHRVLRNVNIGDRIYTWGATSKPLAEVLRTQYPEIEEAVFSDGHQFVVTHGEQRFREHGNYASEAFFDVFVLAFLQGDPATALQGESSAVITDRLARKLFGDDWQVQGHVLGKHLTIDHRKDFTITGVIEDIPANSSLQTDILLPIQDFFARNDWVDTWGNNSFPLYVRLRDGASPAAVSEQIAGVVMAHEEGANEVLFLQPYEDLYLHSKFEDGRLVGGRIEYVRIFSIVGVFILLIAAINFMNLATARSAQRAREIGVRKSIGAARRALVGQFLGESMMLALIAFVFALGLVLALFPFFNGLTGKHIILADLGGQFLLGGPAITLLVGLLAGSYPAFYLSSFNPLAVLRGSLRQRPGAGLLRKGLVIVQFSLSTLLIVASAAVYLQIQYIYNLDVGLDRDNVIYVAQEGALEEQYDAVRRALLARPGISSVTAASANPMSVGSSTESVTWEGKDPEHELETYIIRAEYDFIETMRMEIVAGRTFSREFADENTGFVINEVMAKAMGGGDVIGKPLSFWDNDGSVIGVVKDFDMNSLYAPDEPLIIWPLPGATSRLYVRAEPGRTAEALAGLEAVIKEFNPGYPFDYNFLDETFEAAYRSEAVLGRLASVFAAIAILISCLGLFGLASYTAEQRTKEIGVRKVMGATVPRVVVLLTSEMTKLVALSIVVAIPLSYYVVHAWLANFEGHIDLGVSLFAGAGLLAMVIAWLSVSFRSIQAAMADPVKSLRYE